MRFELAQRAFLIGAHKSAVTGDVACKNRSEPSIDAFFGHLDAPAEISILVYGGIPEANNVRFGSQADVRSANRHVRFTPDSDRDSGLPQKVMSALPPKADMCGALAMSALGQKRTSLN